MSKKELDRYHVLKKVKDFELTQREAAHLLKITDRQIRNLLVSLNKGPEDLISKKRGKPSNHRKDPLVKQKAIALVKEQYEDFGPTFAREKLEEDHEIKISTETLRLWMIESHLWIAKGNRKRIHKSRQRRSCFGEVIQADGSHHHWFGENFPSCNATVFIDDATSKITALVFSETETLNSYYEALEQHLKLYGRPRALYTDRFSVFQDVNNKNGLTQMQKSLRELEIEQIYANSAQAKGRVERVNRTLQDRLVKEMRLKGIKTIEEANKFARDFVRKYNDKFSKKPMNVFDAHRPLEGYDLERILSRSENRVLSSSLSFQFKNTHYQIQEFSEINRLKGRKIEVRVMKDGRIRAFLGERELKILPLDQVIDRVPTMSRKELTHSRIPIKPSKSHPWRGYYYQHLREKEVKRYEYAKG